MLTLSMLAPSAPGRTETFMPPTSRRPAREPAPSGKVMAPSHHAWRVPSSESFFSATAPDHLSITAIFCTPARVVSQTLPPAGTAKSFSTPASWVLMMLPRSFSCCSSSLRVLSIIAGMVSALSAPACTNTFVASFTAAFAVAKTACIVKSKVFGRAAGACAVRCYDRRCVSGAE